MSRRVLFVEDDENIVVLVQFLLEREGFDVTHARDGSQAVALVDSSPAPALVLLDVMVPQASGFDLLAHIRSTPSWAHVPVVMLTAKSGEADIVRALDLGASDYIVKPFQPDELLARIRRLLPRGI